ncbi:MAG TPA: potassium-transporting ATPase subunit C [Candidatus Bathyarchaeia archaeon]|nr:potassium-transporting ATPase subunit C [Candidatus Bathyarchaeia archaeon]
MTMKDRVRHLSPMVRLAVISLILCGLVFPLAVTGLAQALFPFQSNGSIASINGRHVGSNLIAQNFSLPIFFHARLSNVSASGVDPDIPLENALAQIPRISASTGISQNDLSRIVNQNIRRTFWFIGDPFVNVLRLNQVLISTYPFYQAYR